jgi:hypothetical protein
LTAPRAAAILARRPKEPGRHGGSPAQAVGPTHAAGDEEGAPVSYSIRLADHFRYRDAGEEYDPEPVATADEALRLARGIVDRSLDRLWKPGMGAAELLAAYNTFGEDPCIVARAGAPRVEFRAWAYAEERARRLTGRWGWARRWLTGRRARA